MLAKLIYLYDVKGKRISIQDIANQEKAEKGNKIAAIILITILIFLFFAPNLQVMLFFLISGIMIGLLHLKRRKN